MTCPSCAASEISPVTGKCDLCGFAPAATVAVESVDAVVELARRQLEHEFEFKEPVGKRDGTTVQHVVERTTGRTLVLKVLLRRTAEPAAEESFRATMNALAGFDHPNITHVVRHGSTDSLFWFATEDRASTSLAARLAKDGPMELRAARRLLTQVAGALDYLHRHGIVHGAVKPSNILLDGDGWVRLADLSFTRPVVRRISRPTSVPAPRAAWVAPEEQLRGERLPAADQYALGALAFECLTGSTPGSSADAVAQLRADVPARMVRAIERALDEDPTRRFPSCADFLWALEQDVAAAATVAARPSGRVTQEVVMIRDWERAPDPRRTVIKAIQIGLGVLAVAGLALAAPTIKSILGAGPAPTAPAARNTPARVITPITAPITTPSTTPSTASTVPASSASTTSAASPRTITPAPRPRSPAATSADPRRTIPSPAPATVAPAPATTPTAPAPAGGAKLFINASPWGQVSIDGVVIGNTPRANVDLTAGSHTIRVTRPGFSTWERTVRVATGETIRITDIVLVPTQP